MKTTFVIILLLAANMVSFSIGSQRAHTAATSMEAEWAEKVRRLEEYEARFGDPFIINGERITVWQRCSPGYVWCYFETSTGVWDIYPAGARMPWLQPPYRVDQK